MNTTDILKNSLSYVMSQGSMELFHTNFWAGVMRKYPEFAKVFIGDKYKKLVKDGIKREFKLSASNKSEDNDKQYGNGKKSIDILFELNGNNAIVLENKFKSVPTKLQLQMYYDLLPSRKLKFDEGILCTPFKNEIVEENNGKKEINLGDEYPRYRYISYEEIIKEFRKTANTIKAMDSNAVFDMDLVLAYCDDSDRVLELLKSYLEEDQNNSRYTLYSDSDLEELGLNDICSKLSGEQFMVWFKDKLKKKDKELYDTLYTNVDFSNKNVILDFRFDSRKISTDKTNDKYFLIGIQIEGKQYRRVYEERKPKTNSEKTLYDIAIKEKWFGSIYKKEKQKIIVWEGEEYTTGMQDKWCKYTGNYDKKAITTELKEKENKYLFLHQWCNYLEGGTSKIGYDDLYNKLVNDLKSAKEKYDELAKKKGLI